MCTNGVNYNFVSQHHEATDTHHFSLKLALVELRVLVLELPVSSTVRRVFGRLLKYATELLKIHHAVEYYRAYFAGAFGSGDLKSSEPEESN